MSNALSEGLDEKLDVSLAIAYRKRHLTGALKWMKRSWHCLIGNHLVTGIIKDGGYYWYCRGCGKEPYKRYQ